ncbi:MAG: LicD family protein [Roseburia sp.]|nr:LicD family protein [Roseburia sp.]
MEFQDSYFEDEVREGFFIPGMMKRSWAAQLEVLNDIRKVCDRHNLSYFAEWGTMIGAVRHGGIIPWDDDIDICMKRKDFETFFEIAEKELPEGYWLMNYRTHDINNMVLRVINYPISLLQEKDLPRFHGYPYSSGVDIFAMDFLPRDKEGQKALWDLLYLVGQLNHHIEIGETESEEFLYALHGMEKICGVTFEKERALKRQLVGALERVASRFLEEDCEELTEISYYLNSDSYHFPKSYYAQTIELPFENTHITVPIGYDPLLKKKYGDYMRPAKIFDTHDYPGYKSAQDEIRERMKIEPFEYKFSKAELEEAEAGRTKKETLRQNVEAFLPLFEEAHGEIRRMLKEGEFSLVTGILGECQNAAIQLGTMIEEAQGEGHATVGILEQYCETIFRLHQMLSGEEAVGTDEGITACVGELQAFEGRLAESIKNDIKERKEVVFVPYKTSLWGAMESVWKAAMEDEETDVYVIPTPYYYKDDFGKVKKDEPHYETDYPEGVTVTSYEEYNFEAHHPDMVVIQYPYDEYSYGLTVHPFFYAKNLKKYTDQLVYIPPFLVDEIVEGDERGRATLRYFCDTPGVAYADTVIVQSEQMKEVYVELLTEFAGEETKEMWENKILGLGSPEHDKKRKDLSAETASKELPEDWSQKIWRPDGSRKKIILYYVSASLLFSDGDLVTSKMKEVFDLFEGKQDELVMWWRPDPKAREILRKTKPGVWQKYRQLLEEYKNAGWGICDDSTELERAVRFCDAYYGDGSRIANMCRVQKKFIMLQNATVQNALAQK